MRWYTERRRTAPGDAAVPRLRDTTIVPQDTMRCFWIVQEEDQFLPLKGNHGPFDSMPDQLRRRFHPLILLVAYLLSQKIHC